MNLIGLFSLAWVFLSCNQEEGKDNPAVPFPDYGEVLAFPGAEGYGRHATGGRTGEVQHRQLRVTELSCMAIGFPFRGRTI